MENKPKKESFAVAAEKPGYLEDRAARADLAEFDRLLAKIPAVEPAENDKIR